MREMLMLSLMQQQSATERLRGVSGSMQIDQPGTEIVRALLETFMHDPNVNVRLACGRRAAAVQRAGRRPAGHGARRSRDTSLSAGADRAHRLHG